MRWCGVLGWVWGFCVLVMCVGLVGCRFSEPGSVDELTLLEVRGAKGGSVDGAEARSELAGFKTPKDERDAVWAREALENFPLESVIYVQVGAEGSPKLDEKLRDHRGTLKGGSAAAGFGGSLYGGPWVFESGIWGVSGDGEWCQGGFCCFLLFRPESSVFWLVFRF